MLDRFTASCPDISIKGYKEFENSTPIELVSEIKPYNADYKEVKNPIIIASTSSKKGIYDCINWAIQNKGIIYPIGANTNLVESASYQGVELIDRDSPIIYLKYNNTKIVFCNESNKVTCGAMVQLGSLHEYLASIGRRISLDFSAQSATVGGIASTGAGGQEARASSVIDSISMICGDGQQRVFNINENEELSYKGTDIGGIGLALQGTIGVITEVIFKTTPKLTESYSGMVNVPTNKIHEFQQFILNKSPVIACEIIDSRSMENVTNMAFDRDQFTVLIQWGKDKTFELDDLFDELVQKYPQFIDSMKIAYSEKQEAELWEIRHNVSDANRKWAKDKKMNYKGYDLKFPLQRFNDITSVLEKVITEKGGVLFPFGHTMQQQGYVTMHMNFAMKSTIPTDLIRNIIKNQLKNEDITMAAEHGDLGHKSIDDFLETTDKDKVQKLINFWLSNDPNSLFRTDIKMIVTEYNFKNRLFAKV